MIKDLSEAAYYCTIVKAMEDEGEEKYYTIPHKGDIKNLQDYLQELSVDITDMIKDASKEEKQALHKKLSVLTNKVEQIVGN